MWPLKLDMSKDECRGALRRLGEKVNVKIQSDIFSQKNEAKPKQNILKR